jgi:hypothetical protein
MGNSEKVAYSCSWPFMSFHLWTPDAVCNSLRIVIIKHGNKLASFQVSVIHLWTANRPVARPVPTQNENENDTVLRYARYKITNDVHYCIKFYVRRKIMEWKLGQVPHIEIRRIYRKYEGYTENYIYGILKKIIMNFYSRKYKLPKHCGGFHRVLQFPLPIIISTISPHPLNNRSPMALGRYIYSVVK